MTVQPTHRSLTSNPLGLTEADQAWVARTRDSLSVEDKIAQLFVLSSSEDTIAEVDALAAHRPGGIHRFPAYDLDAAWYATRRALETSKVPLILSGDIEGGTLSYSFATPIPNQLGIAACDDLDITEAMAEVVARESRALAYDWSFTPVVDINSAFRNPIVGTRSYGTNVDRIIDHATTYVRVLQAHGIAATAKHWPGDGCDERDQHLATTVNDLDYESWLASFGRVYRALIDDGLMSVMSAHIALPAYIRRFHPDAGREAFVPASVSRFLNEELLRGELGFQGVIVSDATVMGGLSSWMSRAEAVPAVIENGCDVFLFSGDAARDHRFMLDGLRSGVLSEARLETAVTRMLGLKAALGLHRRPVDERLGSLEEVRAALATDQHRAIARTACARSLTLVKDTQALLPIVPDRHNRVVVIADQGSNFFSGSIKRSFDPLCEALGTRGFDVRDFDPDAPPTPETCDLVIYLIGQEAAAALGSIRIDFARLHGGFRRAMMQINQELPTILVSFGQPYYLYDAPNFQTYVNAYCPLPDVQIELVRRLVGEAEFEGVSPVDPFCGLEQLRR